MTLAEWILFIVIAYALYRTLGPIQKRLERRLYRVFRNRSPHSEKPVINITDYEKKKE